MGKSRLSSLFAAAALAVMQFGGAHAQDFPAKPIRILTTALGGSADFVARLMAPGLTAAIGQPVVVENYGGVATIPVSMLMKAAPDGSTLLLHSNSLWIGTLIDKTPYDPIKDLSPVAILTTSSNTLVVNNSIPANSVKDLIAYIKTKPGVLNYGSGASGSSSHIAAELFKSMAGIDVVHVPYKSNAAALTGLMGGDVQLMFPSAAAVAPLIKSGKLRALAVTSAQPSALAPDLPTVASGLPGFESVQLTALFAPLKTPNGLIDRLNKEVAKALNQPDVKDKVMQTGAEVTVSTPQNLTTSIQSEMAHLAKVIKDAGITSQ